MHEVVTYAGSTAFCWLLLATTQVTGQLDGNYVGCFADIALDQKLEPVLENHENLTIEICVLKCYNKANQTKFPTFAALNNGRSCICRNNRGHQLHDRNCNVKCSGDQVQNCGGDDNSTFYSLYSVCELGYYGYKCDQVCHCRRQSACDRMTGRCPNGCEEKWFGTTCNSTLLSGKYIGCFRDNQTRAISQQYDLTGQMTVESCSTICILRNNSIAGLQARWHCFCGEDYARYGPRRESDCSDPCAGNRLQKCGGPWANSVYSVCPIGFYGRNCVNQCHCSDGGSCRFNGSCLNSTLSPCKPGWTGLTCNIRDCGINNGDCEPDEICNNVDLGFANISVCRCKDGLHRNMCTPSHLHYVGCYKGSTTQYVAVELPTTETSTIEFCILKCKQLNKAYSVIQGGEACFCGDDYGQALPDDECQVPCAGNQQQYCGGYRPTTANETSVYAVYTAKSFLRQNIGCYKDNINSRAMERTFSWANARNNTIESCIRHCASLNFTYAGLQHSYACCCGNSYDKYGQLTESNCNMKCAGDNSQICGGPLANNVYAVNDILWCSKDSNCKQNEVCNVIDLKYANVSRCRCKEGFHRMNKWGLCTDIDECQMGTLTCDVRTEVCVNNIGSCRCECKDGFENKSGNCEDIDECKNVSIVCDIETELCTNTIGAYTCQCKPGYENTTFGNCTDVDECKTGASKCNPTSENCVNTNGNYRCKCKNGFVNTSGQCEDMDECKSEPLVCAIGAELCHNTIGSYLCHCKSGYENTTYGRYGKCIDIDECQLDSPSPCNAFSECFNGIGNYTCRCKESFVCGKYDDDNNNDTECNNSNTTGIILGTFLAISLLINALLAIHLVKNARHSGSSKDLAQSNSQRSSQNDWEQQANIYEGTPETFDQDGISEEIVLKKRQVIFKPTSQYALLTQDD